MVRIGIDLGTTNTVAAMVYDDGPHVIPRGQGRIIPSTVAFPSGAESEAVVGEQADNLRHDDPVVRSVKRLMGRTFHDALKEGSGDDRYFGTTRNVRLVGKEDKPVGLEIGPQGGGGRTVWPEEVSALILRAAKTHAESVLGTSIDRAAVTVPAYFGHSHREATLDAARLAGLEVLESLLDEPTAAALAFAPYVAFEVGEPILVVDWGGGTLDVTVLMSNGPQWAQVAIEGELTVGGDDIDRVLADLAASKSPIPADVLRAFPNNRELIEAARKAKEALSRQPEAKFVCPRVLEPDTGKPLAPLAFTLSRGEFDDATRTVLKAAQVCIDRCLSRPDVDRDAIRKVLLVGGSSQIPAFRKVIAELVPSAELCQDVNPMVAVALGAAIFANNPPEIARICPFGFAYVHEDGSPEVVIPAGSEIPTPERGRFGLPAATKYHAQTVYRVKLVEVTAGHQERPAVGDRGVRLFARGLPPTEMGRRVDVELWLDENKNVRGRCHIDGVRDPFPLKGSTLHGERVFEDLADKQLDGEALLAANQRATGGLLDELRNALPLAEVAQTTRDEIAAESALETLSEIEAQFRARRESDTNNAMLEADVRARNRVENWRFFFEHDAVPKFLDLMDAGQQESVRVAIRRLRLQLSTGAGPEELEGSLEDLRAATFSGRGKLVLEAWHEATVVGVPPRMAERLRAASLGLRDALMAEDEEAAQEYRKALEGLLAEAARSWDNWRATGSVLEGGADLRVLRGPGRGN